MSKVEPYQNQSKPKNKQVNQKKLTSQLGWDQRDLYRLYGTWLNYGAIIAGLIAVIIPSAIGKLFCVIIGLVMGALGLCFSKASILNETKYLKTGLKGVIKVIIQGIVIGLVLSFAVVLIIVGGFHYLHFSNYLIVGLLLLGLLLGEGLIISLIILISQSSFVLKIYHKYLNIKQKSK